MAVTHQYHENNTMHKSASKGEFVTFAVKGILMGYMAAKPVRKIEQVIAMILRRIMVLWHVQLPTKMKSTVVSMCVVLVKIKCNKSRKELKTYAMLE